MTFLPASLLIEINLDTPDPALFAAICAEARTAGVERFADSPTWLCFGADELCAHDCAPDEYAEFRENWTKIMVALAATTAGLMAQKAES